ncbi:hypothetical protein AB6F62_04870 [Providencia huaxiensis]|nr:hypothetical protein [Providencia rettgeri]ELR5208949.1 hypothetical protein [Providencia rettgeri]
MSKPTGKLIRLTAGNVGAVPVGRKVNNKLLSADVSLSAGDVGAYSKTETDNKYQPKGNYAPAGNYAVKGDSYTKTESDGRYQAKGNYAPAGNYAIKGDSYTKNEGDKRYEIKGHDPQYKYITVYSGAGMKDNQTIALPQDCRGCWFYFNDAEGVITSAAYLPDDNVEVGINSGASGNARIRLENSGKTFRCVWGGVSGAPSKIRVRVRA